MPYAASADNREQNKQASFLNLQIKKLSMLFKFENIVVELINCRRIVPKCVCVPPKVQNMPPILMKCMHVMLQPHAQFVEIHIFEMMTDVCSHKQGV